MPEGQVLQFSGVTKRFGAIGAVNGFTARVEPGAVTGFLGPNGAGKTTTLRILLGLVRATEGTATVGGKTYAQLADPLQTVGAVLEASSFHPGRSAANHLKIYAQAAGLPLARVDDVLGTVGLADAAGRKVGGFSLGMRQRLGLAYALLGDPGVLVLDEPANGLDPEGIKWLRGLLRELARQGRTVLVSSHLLAEVQQTVDALLIIAHGRLVFQGDLDALIDPSEYATVVDAPDRAALSAALTAAGSSFEVLRSGLTVRTADPAAVGRIAADAGVALSVLQRRGPALEEVFLDLVNGVRVHPSGAGGAAAVAAVPDVAVPADAAPADAVPADAAPAETAPAESVSAGGEPDGDAETTTGSDAVTGTEPESSGEDDREPDVNAAAAASIAAELDAESLGTPGGAVAAGAAAGFAVAGTGVIDIIPRQVAEPPVDADPDVEAIGQIDEELEAPDDGALDGDDVDPERPWEKRVKTPADVEADRFFARFDADGEPVGSDERPPGDDTDDTTEGGEPR